MDNRALLAGLGLGAAAAFLLDPKAGARRRALARDKMTHAYKLSCRGLDATGRDMLHRTRGIMEATRGRLRREPVDDVTLVERVRARLGRGCSHPHAIDVDAHDGTVTLRGPILVSEVNRLLRTTAAVRGVCEVVNELDPHESPEGIPSLQGEGRIGGPTLDLLQSNWAPATRALVALSALAAAGAAATYARR